MKYTCPQLQALETQCSSDADSPSDAAIESNKVYTLDELLAGITEENLHGETASQSPDKQAELQGCDFVNPCARYMGLLAEHDKLVREIERLRAEISNLNVAGMNHCVEIERLRAALHNIIVGNGGECGCAETARECLRVCNSH